MNTSRKKSLLALMTLAVLCMALLAGGTYAYFTAERTSLNVITMGTLNMELVEETTGGLPFPEEGVSGVLPTSVVDKVVYLKNTGTVPFYGRILVEALVTFEDGTVEVADPALIIMDLNNTEWTAQDGAWAFMYLPKVGGRYALEVKVTDAAGAEMAGSEDASEGPAVWRKSVAGVKLTGDWRTDLVAIAQTQIGYQESTTDFIIDEEDVKHGYTRYGDWYGSKYGEWCAATCCRCSWWSRWSAPAAQRMTCTRTGAPSPLRRRS